ncbi:trichohyalin [Drosophila tropicalis]|uniref:trichohyalin n=1 Tax=Drosophila tropicalis TaxID=46794 RepID=UPI0035AC0EC7
MLMQCFILAFALNIAISPFASAANLRTGTNLKTDGRRYQEQDTARAFYSYGYSDANAARAEYTIQDGSSRGFYSYVDANGKLQTVQYEAGGSQGFKAEASNLPKAPVDDGKAPQPVSETEEVQQARINHLKALREAAQREVEEEALAASLREEKAKQEKEQKALGEQQQQQQDDREEGLSEEDAAILERVRAELTAMLADRQNLRKEEQKLNAEETESERKENGDRKTNDNDETRTESNDQKIGDQSAKQINGRKDALADEDPRLRTVYTLSDLSSTSYLKLGELEDRLERLDRLSRDDLRVPIGAYYTLVSPTTRYSVTTPTELRTLRPVALSRSLLLSKRN